MSGHLTRSFFSLSLPLSFTEQSFVAGQPIPRFKNEFHSSSSAFYDSRAVRKSWIKQTFWRLFFFATPAKRSGAWVIRFGFSTETAKYPPLFFSPGEIRARDYRSFFSPRQKPRLRRLEDLALEDKREDGKLAPRGWKTVRSIATNSMLGLNSIELSPTFSTPYSGKVVERSN